MSDELWAFVTVETQPGAGGEAGICTWARRRNSLPPAAEALCSDSRKKERARKVFPQRLAINDATPIHLPRAFVLFSIVSPPLYLAGRCLPWLAFILSFVSIPPPIFSVPARNRRWFRPPILGTSTPTQFPRSLPLLAINPRQVSHRFSSWARLRGIIFYCAIENMDFSPPCAERVFYLSRWRSRDSYFSLIFERYPFFLSLSRILQVTEAAE